MARHKARPLLGKKNQKLQNDHEAQSVRGKTKGAQNATGCFSESMLIRIALLKFQLTMPGNLCPSFFSPAVFVACRLLQMLTNHASALPY